jgi:hypothetical protein
MGNNVRKIDMVRTKYIQEENLPSLSSPGMVEQALVPLIDWERAAGAAR